MVNGKNNKISFYLFIQLSSRGGKTCNCSSFWFLRQNRRRFSAPAALELELYELTSEKKSKQFSKVFRTAIRKLFEKILINQLFQPLKQVDRIMNKRGSSLFSNQNPNKCLLSVRVVNSTQIPSTM